jgi:hypothetical protein
MVIVVSSPVVVQVPNPTLPERHDDRPDARLARLVDGRFGALR